MEGYIEKKFKEEEKNFLGWVDAFLSKFNIDLCDLNDNIVIKLASAVSDPVRMLSKEHFLDVCKTNGTLSFGKKFLDFLSKKFSV